MGTSAGTVTLADDVESTFFEDTDGATSISVHCTSGVALIHVPELHGVGEFVHMNATDILEFELPHMGIKQAIGKGSGGTADINFGVLSKTVPEIRLEG